jgi:ABC-type uncharacterized transport system substrate-binding protein
LKGSAPASARSLLRVVTPGLRRLGIMANSDYPAAVLEMREVEAAAGALGLTVALSEISPYAPTS